MTNWPVNTNPVLEILKENFDDGDKWGSNIRFLFALCDVATEYDVHIPSELQYIASPFGGDYGDDNYQAIIGLLSNDMYIHDALETDSFVKYIEHALKVCAKYDSLLRLAGENY